MVRIALCFVVVCLAPVSLVSSVSARQADSLGISVQTAMVPVANLAASETPSTVACPGSSTLVGGGLRAFYTGTIPAGDPYHPINGLVLRGLGSSDGAGKMSDSGVADASSWTAYAGFAGQNEPNDAVTAFAMCATGGPAHSTTVSVSVNGPKVAQTTASAVATCPSGTRLVGGGARVTPASEPSIKPIGSYPGNAAGARQGVTSDPDSWVAVGESGGLMSQSGGSGSATITTTALAICSADTTLHTTVAIASALDHPSGPGNGNPGSDAIATVTASCPAGTTLLGGGALATGSATGDDGGNIQQGVHLRGSYPSTADASPVGSGAVNPNSWSAIVQSGGQPTPGTDSFAYALCAQAVSAGGSSAGSGGGSGGPTAGLGTSDSSAGTGSGGNGSSSATTPSGVPLQAPKTATLKHGKRGSLTVGSGVSAVRVTWPASGLGAGTVKLSAASAPSVVSGAGGAASGSAAISVSAGTAAIRSLTSFTSPLDIAFPGAAGNVVPAWTTDGKSWTGLSKLASTTLRSGFRDGYYRDSIGTLHVLTLHPGIFALLRGGTKVAKPYTVSLAIPARLDLGKTQTLSIGVHASLASSLSFTLTIGGHRVDAWTAKAKGRASTVARHLPSSVLHAGKYHLVVTAVSGSKASTGDGSIRFVGSPRKARLHA